MNNPFATEDTPRSENALLFRASVQYWRTWLHHKVYMMPDTGQKLDDYRSREPSYSARQTNGLYPLAFCIEVLTECRASIGINHEVLAGIEEELDMQAEYSAKATNLNIHSHAR